MFFLPALFLVLRENDAPKMPLPTYGLHIDVQGIINRLFTEKKQQQPVPQNTIRPIPYSYVISIVDEQAEFGGYNHWLYAGADELRQQMMQLFKTPVCAN